MPDLFKESQKRIITHKAILWKIKSHTKSKTQIFNTIADELAEIGRRNHQNNNPNF